MYTNSKGFKTHLILGGARSGKTNFAENLAVKIAKKSQKIPIYVATAQAYDSEMEKRINTHKMERANRFKTIESPLNIAEPLLEASEDDIILIDCLTLFLSNLICSDHFDESRIDLFRNAIKTTKAKVIVVSNETGLGIVPDNKLARQFRDIAGKLNQDVASIVDRVILIVAGLPLILKGN